MSAKKDSRKSLSRREFLKMTAVVAGPATVMTIVAGCTPQQAATPAPQPTQGANQSLPSRPPRLPLPRLHLLRRPWRPPLRRLPPRLSNP